MALVLLVGLGRVDRAPNSVVTAMLFLLPHLWLAWTGVVFAAWCVLPDRRSLPVVLGALILGGVLVWGPGLAVRRAPEGGDVVRLLSWNVQRLWGTGSARECVEKVVERENPDVLTLLEVSEADLEKLSGLGLTCVHSNYTARPGVTRGGLAVCVRGDWSVQGSGRRLVAQEDWNHLPTEVSTAEHRLNVLAVHVPPHNLGQSASATEKVSARQANQGRALLETIAQFKDPTVVAGDFNSTRDFWMHGQLRGAMQDVWERGGLGFGATRYVWGWLPLRIDFIYATHEFGVRDARVLGAACSDHHPVVTELTLPSG